MPLRSWLQRAVLPQWRIAVALALPLLIWTQSASLLAPAVNILAIPVMGLFILPLSMIGLCLLLLDAPQIAELVLQGADSLLAFLVDGLSAVHGHSALAPLHVNGAPDFTALLYGGVACVLLLAPRHLSSPALALLLLLPALLPKERGALAEDVALEVHVLDVGQGSGVVLRVADKWLVYDAGPALPSGFDAGSAILVPVLRRLGARAIDVLVISHGDTDHAGGVAGLLESLPAKAIYSSEYSVAGAIQQPCRRGQHWRWGEVEFRFLHPGEEDGRRYRGNDGSCVLKVSGADFAVLLPGDIGNRVERELVLRYKEDLGADLLLTPHHGSANSSSYTFIKWVLPTLAVHSSGYLNRFGHPPPRVMARYETMGAAQYITHHSGRLRLRFRPGQEAEVSAYRQERRRYWHSTTLRCPAAR